MKKMAQEKPTISIFKRKPQEANFSVERLFYDAIGAISSDYVCKSFNSRYESRGLFRRLYNIIEAYFNQSDVNHITGDVHYLTYLLAKKKTILTILDCGGLERLKGIRRAVYYVLWYWLPIKRVSLITVISESTKRELLRYVKCDETKIFVIPCCISDEFKPVPKKFNSLEPVLLQIGTGYNKNIPAVAKALSGIPCQLRIIGKLSEEQISQLVASKINYTSAANLSDCEIISEYAKCDALIFVSTYEGFGMPIVEANAIGRPVITSNILSMPEVAGDAACLVSPFNVNEIRHGVVKVVEDADYRNTLIANGYLNALRFKPYIIANQYVRLYEKIISSNKSARWNAV